MAVCCSALGVLLREILTVDYSFRPFREGVPASEWEENQQKENNSKAWRAKSNLQRGHDLLSARGCLAGR